MASHFKRYIMAKYKIVVTDDRYGEYEEEKKVLRRINGELVVTNCSTPGEVIDVVKDADGVLANLAPITGDVIEAMEKCKIISRYGVGYDNVDVATATARGIYVANVPDYCGEDVSDHTITLVMSCLRKTAKIDRKVKAGEWDISSKEKIYRLNRKKYGLIGYGQIAKIVHRKLKGFNLSKVLIYDPFVDAETIEKAGGKKVELNELCRESDFVSIHIPLNETTRGMIGKEQFALMKSNTVIVNVSRGGVVDEKALIETLQNGKIHAAGLDVFEEEPPKKDNPLLKMDNVVLSDHAGWYTVESRAELKTKAAQNVAAVLTGNRPLYPVNKL